MKWFRRILAGLMVLVIVVVVAAFIGIEMYRGTPSWYHPSTLTAEQKKIAANDADQKFLDLFNWAGDSQIHWMRKKRGDDMTSDPAPGPKTITLTEDELSSVLEDWQSHDQSQLQKQMERHFSDSRIVLQEGRIILAGQSKALGALLSATFEPTIDADGKMHLTFDGFAAGRLPLPQSVLAGRMESLQNSMQQRLAQYQQNARVDPNFNANGSAAGAALLRLLADSFQNQISDPLVCIPFSLNDVRRTYPVRMTAIKVESGSLTVTLAPVTDSEPDKILAELQH